MGAGLEVNDNKVPLLVAAYIVGVTKGDFVEVIVDDWKLLLRGKNRRDIFHDPLRGADDVGVLGDLDSLDVLLHKIMLVGSTFCGLACRLAFEVKALVEFIPLGVT